ncbi:MAG TPA: dTDP-glucose 4,6-dehydratase, partial [Candidatus Methylacidiphilales bacterium]|nr:dTDP-glucose 4,6-dehydratase [Candidatus Methylacidiphilales bacterium]
VTGGAGFIGSNLVHHLLGRPGPDAVERIVNLDALSYAGNPDNLTALASEPRHVFVHGSIANEAQVTSLLEKHRIQAVVHLAAETHVDRSIDTPEPFAQTNVVGTLHLLQACRRHWSSLAPAEQSRFRFLHVSTDEVFGSLELNDPPFCETTPYQPRSPYAASKAAADHFVRAYGHTYGLPVVLTNCSNNYGPRQFPEKLIPLMILNALEGRPLPVYGDGLQRRDWLYVEDHCRALELVLQRGRVGETYAISGEAETANLDLLQLLCEILDRLSPRRDGQSYKAQIAHVADRPGHDRRYAMSIRKIKGELGWQPSEELASGLEKTVRWYLENHAWCQAITGKKYGRERLGQL